MTALDSTLRSQLDSVCQDARDLAEKAAKSALKKWAVDAAEPFSHFKTPDKTFRNRLRARGRQAGDVRQSNKLQSINHLKQELAYEYWHRMIFARFLAENQLLMHPDGVAVSLEECEELAKSEGVANGFILAARYASRMLPQIFRTDDVLLEVEFAPEHRIALEKLLASLPRETFLTDDSLGWVYQFWQTKRKDEVNRSEVKIGADELPAVTQLFTEPYMVLFLLHNTLGAWWAGRKLTADDLQNAKSEEELRNKLAVPGVIWECLRFIRETPEVDPGQNGESPTEIQAPWRLAAGTFDSWPKSAAKLKILDPCCGSGHCLVTALNHLVPIRVAEEGFSLTDAVDSVLRDNLYGLEIDERCCQIAAFALAFAAWKLTGYRELPPLHIACAGIGPQSTKEQWVKLAIESGISIRPGAREPIENGLLNLHQLFSQAPSLGALINPAELPSELISADFETIRPYLTSIMSVEKADDETRERAVAAAGMVKAAELLAMDFTLVITNVPYLGRGKQDDTLREHLDSYFKRGRSDLATAFILRCLDFCASNCTAAIVTPQNWLFLSSYRLLRESLLDHRRWDFVARLGPGAFETIGGHVVNVALVILTATKPSQSHEMAGIDVSAAKEPSEKALLLRGEQPCQLTLVPQSGQRNNPDSRIAFDVSQSGVALLQEYAECYQGARTGDRERFVVKFWEVTDFENVWEPFRAASVSSNPADGISEAIRWEKGKGQLHDYAVQTRDKLHDMHESGNRAWGRTGVAINQMSSLRASIYAGEKFDGNVNVIFSTNEKYLPAIWAFCTDASYASEVRRIDQKIAVTNATLTKVPFDLKHWQRIATETLGDNLPPQESCDPSQWLFHGRPEKSTAPLQVAVARLMGYLWPAELDDAIQLSESARELVSRCSELKPLTDNDGIVCIPSIRGEAPAAARLLEMLHAAYGNTWSDQMLGELVTNAGGHAGNSLDDWLRNSFFDDHFKQFHQRPFIWHIWDGRKDGFSCLVNYHMLTYKALENLTHAYLRDWINAQHADAKAGRTGADLRLNAAQELQKKLELILAGEPPYDIFVRWKPLHEQPIGWHPNLNDGVRMNIRPFVEAAVLRKNPNIRWTKDRGKEPERDKEDFPWFWKGKEFKGDRVNDVHLTIAEKEAARAALKSTGKRKQVRV